MSAPAATAAPPATETALLDAARLRALDAAAFQRIRPYPWLNAAGVLTDAAFAALHAALPPLALFTRHFGEARRHGQQPHDRYALDYDPALPVDPVWHRLVAEFEGHEYRAFLARMLGTAGYRLLYHWHYTPAGCAVSPHCDAPRKLGSHIFYFNTAHDWRADWGGETVILDDAGRFDRRSAPAFEDFAGAWTARAIGNVSLLFTRRGNSWHGVRAIRCPEGALRRVFIVVIERAGLAAAVRRVLRRPG
jgi:hypothetical protein